MTYRNRLFSPAWIVWGLSMVLVTVVGIMIFLEPEVVYAGWGFRGFPSAVSVPIATVGLLIVSRHLRHRIGWLLLVLGLASALQGFLFDYGLYSLHLFPGSLPGGKAVAWFLNWYWIIIIWLMSMLLMHFPNGKTPSPRWRPVIGISTGLTILGIVLSALTPGPLGSSFPSLDNPIGVGQMKDISSYILVVVFSSTLFITLGAGTLAPIIRYRRAQGVERQQLKWLAFAAFLIAVTSPTAAADHLVFQLLFISSFFFLLIAIGIAILRYRLYDIDIIIRRTLVYGVLTVLLIGVYFGSVVVLQAAITAVSGQQSPIAIVISTLFIAALFNPLHQRVQAFIDRRFFRSKYDAAQTLARFAQTARDEVEIDALTAELIRVTCETVQPESVTIWLKR